MPNDKANYLCVSIIIITQLSVMCGQLREIYDKKSPIFLTEIGILVATIIIWQYPTTCDERLRPFYLAIMIVSGL
jgi:hypothetical protein